MRRDEGVPPYRRLRRESDTMSFRALVEKSPAVETARNIYAPAYPPAVAHRREIPHNRNENNRTRYAAGRGRPALPTASPRIGRDVISSVSREIPYGRNGTNRTRIIIKIAACRRCKHSPSGRFPRSLPFPRNDILYRRMRRLIRTDVIKTSVHPYRHCHCERSVAISWKRNAARIHAPAYLPAVAHRREIPYGRNGTNRTRIPPIPACAGSAPGGGSPPRRPSDYTKNRSELLFGSVLLTFIRFWFSVRSLSDFADNSGFRSAVTLRRDRLL